jgi:hypothetical protein
MHDEFVAISGMVAISVDSLPIKMRGCLFLTSHAVTHKIRLHRKLFGG